MLTPSWKRSSVMASTLRTPRRFFTTSSAIVLLIVIAAGAPERVFIARGLSAPAAVIEQHHEPAVGLRKDVEDLREDEFQHLVLVERGADRATPRRTRAGGGARARRGSPTLLEREEPRHRGVRVARSHDGMPDVREDHRALAATIPRPGTRRGRRRTTACRRPSGATRARAAARSTPFRSGFRGPDVPDAAPAAELRVAARHAGVRKGDAALGPRPTSTSFSRGNCLPAEVPVLTMSSGMGWVARIARDRK